MKQYIISIIGSTLLCAAAQLLTPANWRKYVKIITGMIILSTIASPIMKVSDVNLFSDFSIEKSEINENLQTELVAEELAKRVEDDIEKRIQDEFSKKSEANVEIKISENNEITGISKIRLKTNANPQKLIPRMCEIYGTTPQEVIVNGY